MKKEVYIFTNDPWYEYSGWRSQTEGLIKVLKDNFNFTIVTFGADKEDNERDYSSIVLNHISKKKYLRPYVVFRYMQILIKERKTLNSVYLPKCHLTVLPLLLLCKLLGLKCVSRISGAELDTPGIKGKLKIFLLRYSSIVIALSQEIKNKLDVLNIKNVLIYNAVNIDIFNPPKDLTLIDRFHLCTFGSVCYRKRTDIALKILKHLKSDGYPVKLSIIGPTHNFDEYEPSYIKKINEYVEEHNLDKDVIFHGRMDHPQVILKKCNIILFPSESEGMPNALLEAMACGCIPIANSIRGVVEIISNSKNGFLVEGNNIEMFVEGAKIVLNSDEENIKLRDNSIKTVKMKFNANTNYQQYKPLFNVGGLK